MKTHLMGGYAAYTSPNAAVEEMACANTEPEITPAASIVTAISAASLLLSITTTLWG
ncbi:LxmA leader domain family RiPP [Streptomyces sp. NPDC005876]|uniref:LxmA leader domain family RiPP n=1 Tax=Streptomyces sp. NPDC005876 TaxID=3157076 RepID=UPI00340389B0